MQASREAAAKAETAAKKETDDIGNQFKNIADDFEGQKSSIVQAMQGGLKNAQENLFAIGLTTIAMLILVVLLKVVTNEVLGGLVGGMIPMFLIVIGWGIHVFYILLSKQFCEIVEDKVLAIYRLATELATYA